MTREGGDREVKKEVDKGRGRQGRIGGSKQGKEESMKERRR